MEIEDRVLVERIKDGDIKAFEQLFHKYERRVFNFSSKMLGNRDDAAEITQEAFARCYFFLKDLRSGEAFRFWLFQIASNLARDLIKKRGENLKTGNISVMDEEEEQNNILKRSESQTPEKSVLDREIKNLLNKSISSLDAIHREVLLLYYLEGSDITDVSKMLNVSKGTVKSRLSRGRMALAKKLKGFLNGKGD
jgi:RNA polymerase sigma-70 factor (ECF subfamily)